MATNPTEPLLDPKIGEVRQPGFCERLCACACCLAFLPLACLGMCCCCATSAVDSGVNKAQGKRWDQTQQKWVIDKLDEEEKEVKKLPGDDEDILKVIKEEDGDNKLEASTVKVKVR